MGAVCAAVEAICSVSDSGSVGSDCGIIIDVDKSGAVTGVWGSESDSSLGGDL